MKNTVISVSADRKNRWDVVPTTFTVEENGTVVQEYTIWMAEGDEEREYHSLCEEYGC